MADNEKELIFFERPRFPRAKTISKGDIELAFVEGTKGARERERIQRYPEYDFASDRRHVVNLRSLGADAILVKPE